MSPPSLRAIPSCLCPSRHHSSPTVVRIFLRPISTTAQGVLGRLDRILCMGVPQTTLFVFSVILRVRCRAERCRFWHRLCPSSIRSSSSCRGIHLQIHSWGTWYSLRTHSLFSADHSNSSSLSAIGRRFRCPYFRTALSVEGRLPWWCHQYRPLKGTLHVLFHFAAVKFPF